MFAARKSDGAGRILRVCPILRQNMDVFIHNDISDIVLTGLSTWTGTSGTPYFPHTTSMYKKN